MRPPSGLPSPTVLTFVSSLQTRLAPDPRLWGAGLAALLLAAALSGPTLAQTPLTLLRRVDGPGQTPREGSPLPEGTTALVLEYPAEVAHTLEAAGLPREELARLLLNRLRLREDTVQLGPGGQTTRRFPPTGPSGEIIYVLARTPADSLYETYVNTGDGFVPGFDAVQSGRMTMGPVPAQPARRYRAVFGVYREETGGAPAPSAQAAAEEDAGETPSSPSRDTTASEARPQESASPEEGSSWGSALWFLLGGILGGGAGAALAWYYLSGKLEAIRIERNNLRRRIKKRKDEEFRRATGSVPKEPAEGETESQGDMAAADIGRLQDENETLREENEELRWRNESLHDQIQKIKKHVERLRKKQG